MRISKTNEGKPILKTRIQGSDITVRFSDKPNQQVKDNIIEILTSCYEGRVQAIMNSMLSSESA